jgi:hypothetical protein
MEIRSEEVRYAYLFLLVPPEKGTAMRNQLLASIFVGLLIGVCTILSSCAGEYGEFYTKVANAPEQNIRAHKTPEISFQNKLPEMDTLTKYGYTVLGYSIFQWTYHEASTSKDNALAQGADVGADLIIALQPQIIGTEMVSVDVDKTATINTHTNSEGNGTVSGNGRHLSIWGQSNSESQSTVHYTEQQNIQENRYQFGAVFLLNTKNSTKSPLKITDTSVDSLHNQALKGQGK